MSNPNDIDGQGRLVLDIGLDAEDNPINYVVPTGAVDETLVTDKATLYQSRSYQQALDETGDENNAGWEAIVHGWEVAFVEGTTPYGQLAALNRNIQQAGETGPTDTSGKYGNPSKLNQGATISGKGPQVLGWKSDDTSTSYAPNVARIDPGAGYIYADAFFSWTEDSATIIAPGASNSESLLVFSPANVINVTL